ncbi:MAG: HAMP domain-containing protein [Gemmatimonas sp.]|nr:HAMP domain-containing protein [Gemmatimonas sp.]
MSWVSAWIAVLALAVWLSQLAPVWLGVAAVGSSLWTVGVAQSRGRLWLAAAAAMWVAVGTAGGVQYRLDQVLQDWDALQLRVEERSAEALDQALDDMVEAGERAVGGAAEAAAMHGNAPATPELFTRLHALQRATGVSAIALFAPDGSSIAWEGEHRGEVPLAARRGEEDYLFHEGPLFSYVYFVRPLPDGVTAAATFLLEAGVDIGEGIIPFAEGFEDRYATRPLFSSPERAQAEAVWDWVDPATEQPILSVSFAELTQQHWWERVVAVGRLAVGLAGLISLLLFSAGWYRSRMEGSGVPVLVGTAALLIAPLGQIIGADVLFSPLQFVLPGRFDITLGVLVVLLFGLSVWVLTRTEAASRIELPERIWVAILVVIFPLGLVLINRSAADGLLAARPAGGFAVQLATVLSIGLALFLVMRFAREPRVSPTHRRLARIAGYTLPAIFAVLVVLLWRPASPLPFVLATAWALPAALLIAYPAADTVPLRSLRQWLVAGWIAGTVSLAFLWPMHVRAELERAEREIGLLGTEADPYLDFLLRQFAEQAESLASDGESGVNLLYRSWTASGLASEGYEARISLWEGGEANAELNLSELPPMSDDVSVVVTQRRDRPFVAHYQGDEGLHYLLAAPLDEQRTVSVEVPPRRRVTWATPLARFLYPEGETSLASRGEVLYLVPVANSATSIEHTSVPMSSDTVHWVKTGEGWRSETLVDMPEGPVHAHMLVPHPGLPLLFTRAILIQAAILLTFLLLWLLGRAICRDLDSVPLLRVGWLRSFRGRLSFALFFFFLLPTLVFGAVSYGAVASEVVRSAAALAQQALNQAATRMPGSNLSEVGGTMQTDLLMYRQGTLVGATAPEVIELGLFHAWLPPEVYLRFAGGEALEALDDRRLAENDYLVAYRRLDAGTVLAAPVALASQEIIRRQQEFRDVALLVILLGLGLSVVLSLFVSRALSSPLDELSRAAVTVGAGNFRTPLPETRSDEFGSVYASFNRMVRRLSKTRAALVQETRRTETIVAEAATGVLALDSEGRVELINPRASEILGVRLRTGQPLLGPGAPADALSFAIAEMWSSPSSEAEAELEQDGRYVRMRLRRLSGDNGAGGAVVALEDVSAEVRTARVLAWGEMARQVAHEIKNPLTPIKLAVQHLRRAYLDERSDFRDILERNVESILREIDRLGEIARAFSRFGTPAVTATPLEDVDVVDAVQEVIALYRGSADESNFRAALPTRDLPAVVARSGELKEVLINLLENAREAVDGRGEVVVSAIRRPNEDVVRLTVADTGVGIPSDQLPRIFEPQFSTRSSGTGLGLAIVRRLVESWGAEISATSKSGTGSHFEILLQVAVEDDSAPGRPGQLSPD